MSRGTAVSAGSVAPRSSMCDKCWATLLSHAAQLHACTGVCCAWVEHFGGTPARCVVLRDTAVLGLTSVGAPCLACSTIRAAPRFP